MNSLQIWYPSTHRRIDQRQLVNLIARLTHKSHDRISGTRSVSCAAARAGTLLESSTSASRGLDIEVPGTAVTLTSAKHSFSPVLAGSESQRYRCAASAAVRKRRAVRELDAHGVEALSTAERDDGSDWGGW